VAVAGLQVRQAHQGLPAVVVVIKLRQAVQAFRGKDLRAGLVLHQRNRQAVVVVVQVRLVQRVLQTWGVTAAQEQHRPLQDRL
jgi:hypothetical protein